MKNCLTNQELQEAINGLLPYTQNLSSIHYVYLQALFHEQLRRADIKISQIDPPTCEKPPAADS